MAPLPLAGYRRHMYRYCGKNRQERAKPPRHQVRSNSLTKVVTGRVANLNGGSESAEVYGKVEGALRFRVRSKGWLLTFFSQAGAGRTFIR